MEEIQAKTQSGTKAPRPAARTGNIERNRSQTSPIWEETARQLKRATLRTGDAMAPAALKSVRVEVAR